MEVHKLLQNDGEGESPKVSPVLDTVMVQLDESVIAALNELPALAKSVKVVIELILGGSETFHRKTSVSSTPRTSSLPDSEIEMVPLADSKILVPKKPTRGSTEQE
ncbi:hypothetical protein PHYPO_G00215160 [Pangasianodon hypophthalmus]|uniref:Uncharacterized protein n=1 Tax=Pangasianodon hypophthalmus TaxID=310915 RepID=A0A5N5P593_PANHP|nr:hypothetical protein PHYPO_G00215160 [Pangasianodon hypophthalmus]